jgi:hypothetical protein
MAGCAGERRDSDINILAGWQVARENAEALRALHSELLLSAGLLTGVRSSKPANAEDNVEPQHAVAVSQGGMYVCMYVYVLGRDFLCVDC